MLINIFVNWVMVGDGLVLVWCRARFSIGSVGRLVFLVVSVCMFVGRFKGVCMFMFRFVVIVV